MSKGKQINIIMKPKELENLESFREQKFKSEMPLTQVIKHIIREYVAPFLNKENK